MNTQFHFDKNSLLDEIPAGKYRMLANILERTNFLEKLEKLRPKLYEVIKPHMHVTLSCKTPTEQLLANLIDQRCKIIHFVQLLRICKLYEALSILITERITVFTEPTEHLNDDNILKMKTGNCMSLEFTVQGIPLPTYQWYKNDILLMDEISSQFTREKYTHQMSGDYYSIAYQTLNGQTIETLRSKTVIVETLMERCVVVKRPLPEINVTLTVMPEPVTLKFTVRGFPPPKYVWLHGNTEIKGNRSSIQILNQPEYEGEYRCRISNEVTEDITEKIIFSVTNPFMLRVCKTPVTEKVALLIANEDYNPKYYVKLETPRRDVMAIKEKLENLGFLVLAEYNRNLESMRKALTVLEALCVEGCYVFFYFVGHGFQYGQKYLLPVDAEDSSNITRKSSIDECEILQKILCKKPKLFITILDMCLSIPNKKLRDEEPEYISYKSNKNLIQVYSTSTGSSAYDFVGTEFSLYNKLLQNQLDKNVSVLQMFHNLQQEFERVAANITQKNLAMGVNNNESPLKIENQMPSINTNLAQDFSLSVSKIGHPITQRVWNLLLQRTIK